MSTPGGSSNAIAQPVPQRAQRVQLPGIEYVTRGILLDEQFAIVNNAGPPSQAFQYHHRQPAPRPASELINTAEDLAEALRVRSVSDSTPIPIPIITADALRGYLAVRRPALPPAAFSEACVYLCTRCPPKEIYLSLRFNYLVRQCTIRGFSRLLRLARTVDPGSVPATEQMIADLQADVGTIRAVGDKLFATLTRDQKLEVNRRAEQLNLEWWQVTGYR